MKRQSLGVLLSFAMLASLAAFAETVSEDTTITLTADSNTSYEISDGVTLTIEVVKDSTYSLSGQITGTGTAKLRKTGLGTLALSNGNNDIPGGIDIAQGTIRADVQGCLGDGPISITQGQTPLGQVNFNAQGAAFNNDFTAAGTIPANTRGVYALYATKSVTLNGTITATANGINIGGETAATVTLNGDCTSGTQVLFLRLYGPFIVNGKISANCLWLGNNSSAHGNAYLNNPSNSITYIKTYQPVVHCGDTNVLRNAYWSIDAGVNRTKDYHTLDLHGHDQTMKFLSNVGTGSTKEGACPITSDSPCTLTLTCDSTVRNSGHILNGAVSLVIDAAKSTHTQCFTDVISGVTTTHSTTGTIHVKKGTLKISGGSTSFSGVPQVTVDANGTLDIETSGQTVFEVVKNFTVEGNLVVGSTASAPFMAGVSSLTLGEDASFTVNNAAKSIFSEVDVVIDGVLTKLAAGDYDYPDDRVPQLKAGGFSVVGSGAISSATWTGGGEADTAMTNTDNWDNDGVDFSTGLLSATFATGGNTATVSSNVKFQNMTLNAAEGEAGFTFAKGSDSGVVTLTGTTLNVADADSTNRTYAFDVPLAVEGTQTMTASLPAKKTLALNDGIVVPDGSFLIVGAGTPRISGNSVVSGAMSIDSGTSIYLSGLLNTPSGVDQGAASVDGANTFTINGGTTESSDLKGLVLTNATVRKPVAFKGNSSNSQKWLLHTLAGTTNEISGDVVFTLGYGRNNMKLRRNSELTCSGGMRTAKSTICIDGDAGSRLLFTGRPVSFTTEYVYEASTYYFGLEIARGHVVFDVCGNAINYLRLGRTDTANYSTKMDFMRSDMFSGYATTLAAGMSNSGATLTPHTKATSQTVDFHSTTQRFARVVSGATATFSGDAGSVLEVYGAQMPDSSGNIHVTDDNLYVAAKFEGGLSLKMGGTGTLLLTNAVSSTSGGIEVTNGTVKVAYDAAWTNAAYVAVGGAGRLEIDAADGELGRLNKFSPETVVFLSEDGVVSVPNGTEIRVANVFVDGVALPPGRYSYASAPEPLKSHLADTTGEIVAGKPGLVIFLR